MAEQTPAPSPLNYAPQSLTRRMWARRLLRRWPLGLVMALIVLAIIYGPRAWQHWKLLRMQEACMTAELPTGRPVREDNSEAAGKLIKARPGEYQAGTGPAVRVDPRWAAVKAGLKLPSLAFLPPNFPLPTTFCQERYTPSGKRRLIVVEEWAFIAVIEPAGWLTGDLRLIDRSIVMPDATSMTAFGQSPKMQGSTFITESICDPVDRARFTVSFLRGGVTGTWEYRLGDNDRITVRLLDPDGFTARAKAAKAAAEAAATRPATRVVRPAPR